MKKIQDQIGNFIELQKTPKRIISLVPSQTELLVDLGLEDAILGITKFCIHPTYLKKTKTIVGGTKNINIEKIKALNPDIILCNKEENTKEIVKACEKITTTHVSDIFTLVDVKELITQYGNIFSCQYKSETIISDLDFLLNNFKEFIGSKKSKKVIYFIWKNPWMVAANTNFINYLLELNKFENCYQNKERYPEIDIYKVIKENPDLLLLSSEPYPFKEKDVLEIEKITNTKTILVDGEMFSWYGSRLLKAFDYFKTLHRSL